MQARTGLVLLTLLLCGWTWAIANATMPDADTTAPPGPLRVATFNSSLNDNQGRLIDRLLAGDAAARRIAATIQRLRPDVILLNEFDFDPEQRAAELFQRRYLEVGQFGEQPITYAYRFSAAVNTGLPSGLDINGDGKSEGPGDAYGFGRHPGQFGMLVLSRYPLQTEQWRSFQTFLWHQMPNAHRPMRPDSDPPQPFHADAIWKKLRLSSKSHWDLPVATPLGTIHLLLSHPTPPVFDGREDFNGLRNRDEILFWVEYLRSDQPQSWLTDDQGRSGPLDRHAQFVILGDLNNDPEDGAGHGSAMRALLQHPRIARFSAPQSAGAVESAQRRRQAEGRTPLSTHTAEFEASVGSLRVDYVIPSAGLTVEDAGVFWPTSQQPESDWLKATDHRLVWMDLRLAPP